MFCQRNKKNLGILALLSKDRARSSGSLVGFLQDLLDARTRRDNQD